MSNREFRKRVRIRGEGGVSIIRVTPRNRAVGVAFGFIAVVFGRIIWGIISRFLQEISNAPLMMSFSISLFVFGWFVFFWAALYCTFGYCELCVENHMLTQRFYVFRLWRTRRLACADVEEVKTYFSNFIGNCSIQILGKHYVWDIDELYRDEAAELAAVLRRMIKCGCE